MANPLPSIYTAFWQMLEDNSDFTSLVPEKNRQKYYTGSTLPPERDVLSPSDRPEVRVKFVGARPDTFGDSSSSGLALRWSVEITTGDVDQETLLDVVWAIWESLHDWSTRMTAIEWESTYPVKWCRAFKWDDTLENQELNRGTRGWSSVWMGEIGCWFARSGLMS